MKKSGYNGTGGPERDSAVPNMIVFIAPYEKLKETADRLISRYDIPITTAVGDLGSGLEIARRMAADGAIVVSRGGTAKLIRDRLGIDVIEIGVSPYDLLQALKPYIGGSRRVAVMGFRGLTETAREVCRVLDVPAIFLPVDDEKEIPENIETLRGLGVECLIGDMVSIRSAGGLAAELHLMESGPAAVADALDKAAVVARSVISRRRSDLRIRAMVNSVQDGIISVDRDGSIENVNRKAIELLGGADPTGLPFEAVVQGMDIRRVMSDGAESFGKLVDIEGFRTVANVTPITVDGRSEGAVAVLQEIGKIQDIEKKVRKQLYLKGFVARHRFSEIRTRAPAMVRCVEIARQYAQSTSSIVIFGETGTGKEFFAQSIHNESPVADGPFVAINCGALPPTLMESELFGYAEGAFTGAMKGGKAGLFELAHGGTIFLDEINELDIQLQNKLLRVLQEREVMRVGDTRVIPISVRVLVASNVPLSDEIERGRLRRDLFYRLNVLDIKLLPLRERREDIPHLFAEFVGTFAHAEGGEAPSVPGELTGILFGHSWPGNVRELENVAEKYTVLRRLLNAEEAVAVIAEALRAEDALYAKNCPPQCRTAPISVPTGSLEEIERNVIRSVFDEEGQNVSRAAKRLGIDRQTLRKRLDQN